MSRFPVVSVLAIHLQMFLLFSLITNNTNLKYGEWDEISTKIYNFSFVKTLFCQMF